MQERILITGINGFIGRRVATTLLEQGHALIGLDRSDSCFNTEIPYVKADITDHNGMAAVFEDRGITAVVHLAALVHNNNKDHSAAAFLRINYEASRNLFQLCAQNGVKAVLFASTIEVYGEHDEQVLDENTPCNPASDYGRSKYLAEQALREEMPEGSRWAALRLAPVYDRDFRLNLDKRFYMFGKRAAVYFRKGEYSFNFCSTRNILEFIATYFGSDAPGGVYLLSDRQNVTARQFIDMEKRHTKIPLVLRVPYYPTLAAIFLLDSAARLFHKGNLFISLYNFHKMFKSTVYNSEKARLVTPMEATLEDTLYGK